MTGILIFYIIIIAPFVFGVGRVTYEAFIRKNSDETRRLIAIKSMAQSFVFIFIWSIIKIFLELFEISVFRGIEVQSFIIYAVILRLAMFINIKSDKI